MSFAPSDPVPGAANVCVGGNGWWLVNVPHPPTRKIPLGLKPPTSMRACIYTCTNTVYTIIHISMMKKSFWYNHPGIDISLPKVNWIQNNRKLSHVLSTLVRFTYINWFRDVHQPYPPHTRWYCWWKKSCTTWDVKKSVHTGIDYSYYLSTGAGFLPSTVCTPVFFLGKAARKDEF